MKTFGPQINKWQQYRTIILVLIAVIAMVVAASFVLKTNNRSMLYIGLFAYAAIILTMMLRKMAEKVDLDTASKKIVIHTYNVFSKDSIVIPFNEAEFEYYVNKLTSRSKGGILFYQKSVFKFYLTVNQPGWTLELIKEVEKALGEAKVKCKTDK